MAHTILAWINLVVASGIIYLFVHNRHRLFEQSMAGRIGMNLMAVACTAIVIKLIYLIATDSHFYFDPYGVLFRSGYLTYMIGSVYSMKRDGASIMWKADQDSVCMIRKGDESRTVNAAYQGHHRA